MHLSLSVSVLALSVYRYTQSTVRIARSFNELKCCPLQDVGAALQASARKEWMKVISFGKEAPNIQVSKRGNKTQKLLTVWL